MPYWFELEGKRVGRERNKNRKLSDEQIEEIRFLYNARGWSIRALARKFKVDRNAIKYHLFEHFKEKINRRHNAWLKMFQRTERGRAKHREYIKNYREHLKEIYGLRRKQGGENASVF